MNWWDSLSLRKGLTMSKYRKVLRNGTESNNIVFLREHFYRVASPDFRCGWTLWIEIWNSTGDDIKSYQHIWDIQKNFTVFTVIRCYVLMQNQICDTPETCRVRGCGQVKAVITQNIDGLHQMAGSQACFRAAWQRASITVRSVGKGFDAGIYFKIRYRDSAVWCVW